MRTIDCLPDACVALVLTRAAEARASCVCRAWARAYRGSAEARLAALRARADNPVPQPAWRTRAWLAAVEAADADFPGTLARALTGCASTLDRMTRAVSGGQLTGSSTPLVVACHALMAGATRTAAALLRASRDASRFAPPEPYLIKAFYHCAAACPAGLQPLRDAWAAPERARGLRGSAVAAAAADGWARWHAHRAVHVALFEAAVDALQHQHQVGAVTCHADVLRRVLDDAAWALGAFSRIIGAGACWTVLWVRAPALTRAAIAPRVMAFTPHLAYAVCGVRDVQDVRALERAVGRPAMARALARAAPWCPPRL